MMKIIFKGKITVSASYTYGENTLEMFIYM